MTGSAFFSRRSADAIPSPRGGTSSESSSFRTQLSSKLPRPYTKSVNRRRRLMKSDFTSGDLAPSTTLPARDWAEQRKLLECRWTQCKVYASIQYTWYCMYLIGFSHCSGKFNRQLHINVSQKPVTFSATRLERHAGQSRYEGYSFASGTPPAPAALVPACNAPVANENIPCRGTVPEIVERDASTVSINTGTFQRHLEHYHGVT
jgi:hypothetical protein